MKKFAILFLGLNIITINFNCTDYDDKPSASPVNSFIWNALNDFYLYQPQVTNLADEKAANNKDFENYLKVFSAETLFESLIFDRANTDKYSVLFSDYLELEKALQGSSNTNGMEFGLTFKQGSTTDIFGWVKYVMPNSNASATALQRGAIFYAINGTPLTVNNRRSLLNLENYTLNLANYNNGQITPNGQSITLTKTAYSENPVFYSNTYTVGANKVGYLVYNGFFSNYETELNAAVQSLKSQNITHFVLDLRYNSGGSIATATRLASMITGQFTGQLFSKNQWSPKIEPRLSNQDKINNFTTTLGNGNAIASLNLNKVYVLTSRNSASASELVINSLKPYINVVQIGAKTAGKNVGSITMYDSPDYRKNNLNPNHRYAMQPIVLKVINAVGFGDYQNGISPTNPSNELNEDVSNLSQLGNPNELLLAKALNVINLGGKAFTNKTSHINFELIDSENSIKNSMYLE